jgi:hypothetical protein
MIGIFTSEYLLGYGDPHSKKRPQCERKKDKQNREAGASEVEGCSCAHR